MAALLVAMSVIAIVIGTTMPVFSTMARREREAELVFRGQQYARAVSLFQRKYGNALPPNVDVLLNERFLRKQYKDPITGDDFTLVGPGSPELADALNSAPGQQPGGRGGTQGRGTQGRSASQMSGGPQMSQVQPQQQLGLRSNPVNPGEAPGGILGVVSKSKQTSLRLYNNRDKYNEWVFTATQMSTAAGGGATGAQAPGARGGAALGGARGGRRGEPPPVNRGGFGQPPPGGRPLGNSPAGPGMGPQNQPGRR
jgi:type II secretory pathway pseudopilin PulG